MKVYFRLHVEGAPKPFWVDRKFIKHVVRKRWRYMRLTRFARAYFAAIKERKLLHRYLLELEDLRWPEVYFANGDFFDCRISNLKPYRHDEEGAQRKRFKNNTSGTKGVYFRKTTRKWQACIRVKGKLLHLGYFSTVKAATDAYSKAWALAHPGLPKRRY